MRSSAAITLPRLRTSARGGRGAGRARCSRLLHIAMPPLPALFAQLLIGLINGAFYAMLSLGLAIIFGLLNIINFAHGALYMMGAFCAWFSAELARHRLLVGAAHRADRRRRLRHGARAAASSATSTSSIISTGCC